jgi:hypothetical protein
LLRLAAVTKLTAVPVLLILTVTGCVGTCSAPARCASVYAGRSGPVVLDDHRVIDARSEHTWRDARAITVARLQQRINVGLPHRTAPSMVVLKTLFGGTKFRQSNAKSMLPCNEHPLARSRNAMTTRMDIGGQADAR